MTVRKRPWHPVYLSYIPVMGSIGWMLLSVEPLTRPVEAQSLTALRTTCVGIAPLERPKTSPHPLQNRCCQRSTKGRCVPWKQLFPAAVQSRAPSVQRPVSTTDVFSPQRDAYGNSIGSQGAAKDAVIQVGVTKALAAITPKLKALDGSSRGDHRPSFFQRARKTYQQVLGPRILKSGAILTPQVDMNLNLGAFSVDSMKLGIEIQF